MRFSLSSAIEVAVRKPLAPSASTMPLTAIGFFRYAHHTSASNDAYRGCRMKRYAPTVTSVLVFSKARLVLRAAVGVGLPISRSSRNPSIASPIEAAPRNQDTSWRAESELRNHTGTFSRIRAASSSNAKKR